MNQFVQLAIESRGREVVRKKDLRLLSKYFSKKRELLEKLAKAEKKLLRDTRNQT